MTPKSPEPPARRKPQPARPVRPVRPSAPTSVAAPRPELKPRQAQKTETRRALEQAALRCFAATGWEATTVGAIAKAAGVAHGTFYVHFPTKEALADALLAEFNANFAARVRPIWETGAATLPTRVRRTAEAFLDHWESERVFVAAYARRLGAGPGIGGAAEDGVTLETLRDGINPPAVALLGDIVQRLLGPSAMASGRMSLAVHGVLALWLRVGLQTLFQPGVKRKDGVEVLTRMTLGAVMAMVEPPVGLKE